MQGEEAKRSYLAKKTPSKSFRFLFNKYILWMFGSIERKCQRDLQLTSPTNLTTFLKSNGGQTIMLEKHQNHSFETFATPKLGTTFFNNGHPPLIVDFCIMSSTTLNKIHVASFTMFKRYGNGTHPSYCQFLKSPKGPSNGIDKNPNPKFFLQHTSSCVDNNT